MVFESLNLTLVVSWSWSYERRKLEETEGKLMLEMSSPDKDIRLSLKHGDLDDEVECLRLILENMDSEPPGPMYQDTNKHLAELLLNSGNEEEADYHLSESHGCTLRNQACSLLGLQIGKCKGDTSSMRDLVNCLEFGGDVLEGVPGLFKRLSDLPPEWTVLQLTLQWDPLSRFPPRNRDVNRGLGIFLTRFSCGDISKEMNELGEGGKPITVFIPTVDDDLDRLSLMAAMRSHLSKLDNPKRDNRRKIHDDSSNGVQATVNEMQSWIGGWHSLFLGRLTNDKLQKAIKKGVDLILSSYVEDVQNKVKQEAFVKFQESKTTKKVLDLPEKTLKILYLLAASPAISFKEILAVISTLFHEKDLASKLSKDIDEFRSMHTAVLKVAERHPVILLIDEELDILPFEVMSPLEDQPFTRMPSIHFLHAYYLLHKNTTLRNGIDPEKCYYVINPTKTLPMLEKVFNSISALPCVQKWKGLLNKIPAQEEVLCALQQYDIFLYCGHGGGNQFISRESVQRNCIKSVVLLFGCSSSSLEPLGGRVEMTSLFYNYLLGGSPCVVGMLWPVLDSDVNAMTEKLIKLLSFYDKPSVKAGNIEAIEAEFKNMKINSSKRNISEAVQIARKSAARFLNRAALVVRGLPVYTVKNC